MKRILTIQDLSCVGQCSLTVALPILSAAGLETSVLPTAVLSTHTAGFSGYTFRDLAADFDAVLTHWEKEKLTFDGLYTGYLGNASEIQGILRAKNRLLTPSSLFIVDPAMADNGRFYPGFDDSYGLAMRKLSEEADILLPNLTEACFLTGTPYQEVFSEEETMELIRRVAALNHKKVVLTGIHYEKDKIGVATCENGEINVYFHKKYAEGSHGTGDIYSSVFVAAYMRGKSLFQAAKTAADFTVRCIGYTKEHPEHWYGAYFEPFLKDLAEL